MNEDVQLVNAMLKFFEKHTDVKQVEDRIVTGRTTSVRVKVHDRFCRITVELENDE